MNEAYWEAPPLYTNWKIENNILEGSDGGAGIRIFAFDIHEGFLDSTVLVGSFQKPTFMNLSVRNNTLLGSGKGGGIHLDNTDVNIINSDISANSITGVGSGAGAYMDNSVANLINTSLSSNQGDAIYVRGSRSELTLLNTHIDSSLWNGIMIFDSAKVFMDSSVVSNSGASGIHYLSGDSLFISSSFITNNGINEPSSGGGIRATSEVDFGSVMITIDSSNIVNNNADLGGGIYYYLGGNSSFFRVNNSIIANNSAQSGGAIYSHSLGGHQTIDGEFYHCLIEGNSAQSSGSAIYLDETQPAYINCTITNNSGPFEIYSLGSSSIHQPILVNSIIWGNSNLLFSQPGIVSYHSDFESNSPSIIDWGGTISIDPLFQQNSNYMLSSQSPCVDAGTEYVSHNSQYEFNVLNFGGSAPDLGYSEYMPVLGTFGLSEQPRSVILNQNYPNPFNPSTTISYELPEHSEVSLVIYDITGRVVRTLVSALQEAGSYTATWNGTDIGGHPVAGGMYFARIQASEYSSAIKMLYLR